jgi:mono/diheme cytochrome c family protein
MRFRPTFACVPLLLACAVLMLAQSAAGLAANGFAQQTTPPSRSTRDGVYTTQQAKRGEDQYQLDCSSCHGAMLTGGDTGSPLIGSDFVSKWAGRSIADLFEYTRNQMPKDSPGRLSRQQYADVLTYILSANKYPAGDSELKSDADSLQKIEFETPQP